MTNRFKLEHSQDLPNWWVLTDIENLIVCKFKEHEFNETQRITILDDSKYANNSNCANEIAHIMAEMGDYMFSHWYSIALPTPVFEFRQDDKMIDYCLFVINFQSILLRYKMIMI